MIPDSLSFLRSEPAATYLTGGGKFGAYVYGRAVRKNGKVRRFRTKEGAMRAAQEALRCDIALGDCCKAEGGAS